MRKKIIFIIICLFLIIGSFVFLFLIKENDTTKYLAFDSKITLNNYDVYDYNNDYYVVYNGEKYALINRKGEEKLPFKYDYIEILEDYILTSEDNNYTLYNFDFDIILSNIQTGESTTCLNHKYVFYQDDKAFLIDNKGKYLLNNYEAIHCENNLIIASKDNYDDIFDKDLKEIFSKTKVSEINNQYFEYLSLTNANFLVLKVEKGYQVYAIKNNKLSETFSYVSLNDNLFAATTSEGVKIYDNNLNVINNFHKNYNDYQIINQNILAVPNKSCNFSYQDNYYDLYNKDNTKLTSGCNTVLIDNDYTVMKDEANLFTIYDDNGAIFNYQGTKNSYLYPLDNQEFKYLDENNKSHLLNINGEELYPNCQTQIDKLASNIYLCAPNNSLYYIYQNNKLMWDKPYYNIAYQNGFYIVENSNGLQGLYDKLGNQILEEKYDQINIYNDDLLIIKLDNQTSIYPLKLVDKKTYLKFLKEDHNIISSKVENKIEDIADILNKYDLNSQKDLIFENQDLFKIIAYHVENNLNIDKEDKQNFYSLFASVIDYAKFNSVDNLLAKLDTLIIKKFKNRPNNMRDFSAGEYHQFENTIYILEDYYDYAIRHELMHFISFSLIDNKNTYYICEDKILNYDDMAQQSIENQANCSYNFISDNTFLEEAGAEYFTKVVYQNLPYESYPKSNIAYNLLQYILQDNFLDIQYNTSKPIALAKKLNKKLDLTNTEITTLLTSLHNLNQNEQELVSSYSEQNYNLAKVANELINLYELKTNANWQDNDYVALAIKSLLEGLDITGLENYLQNNKEAEINNLNDLKEISLIDPLTNILTFVNSSSSNVNYYFMNENLNFKIRLNFNDLNNNPKIIDVYINPEGNIIDEKVITK